MHTSYSKPGRKSWAAKYIGLAFAEGGRGPDSYDCWGLVAAVLRNERRIEVEPFAEVGTFDRVGIEAKVRDELARNDWQPVDPRAARPFDVALMWIHRRLMGRETARSLSHIGIVEAPGRLLHIDRETRSVSVPFARLMPAFQLQGFYRHRRLA